MKDIFVVTSTRADYGLLRPVIKRLAENQKLNLVLVATGTHLLPKFGNTITEIENDGFETAYKTEILKFENTDIGVAKTIAYTVEKFTALFSAHRPDMLVLLGDRYEIFAVATAASALGIPIAHISGGDVTQGAKDDFYRHCITHMSALHFPSCQDSYNRLLRLGQNPDTVFNVGGLGDENIRNMELLSLQELSDSLKIENLQPFALITYHPETQKNSSPKDEMEKLLAALDNIENLNYIFTKSNADAGGEEINKAIDDYCKQNSRRAYSFFSLGAKRYLSAMKYARVVIGNSSSGVVETPTFKVPCVNIGDRQKGRHIAKNVICTKGETADILQGIEAAITDMFSHIANTAQSPYYNGCVPSEEIVKHIEKYVLTPDRLPKEFYDGE